MKRIILAVSLLPIMSACITTSNNGSTADGKPVHVEVQGGTSKQVAIELDNQVTCNGAYTGTSSKAPKTFPLACSDGRTGTATMKAVDGGITGILEFSVQGGPKGTVSLTLGENVASPSEAAQAAKDERLELDRDTCVLTNAAGKARMAFFMRIGGVAKTEARKQLGAAKPGTVGYAVREAALDAAYSANTETAKEADFYGLVNCIDRLSKA